MKMRFDERVALMFVLLAALAGDRSSGSLPGATPAAPAADDAVDASVDDSVVFDAVARFNERMSANIDSVDNSALAILAGDFGVAVFGIDRVHELAPWLEPWFFGLIATSIGVAALSYTSFLWVIPALRPVDGAEPRSFVRDLSENREDTLYAATSDLVDAGEQNRRVRTVKRVMTYVALFSLIAAAIVVGFAREYGKVLQSP